MIKVSYEKLEMLRESMHISKIYLARVLGISVESYLTNHGSYHLFDKEMVRKLTIIFGVSQEYLKSDITTDEIGELYGFQRMVRKY